MDFWLKTGQLKGNDNNTATATTINDKSASNLSSETEEHLPDTKKCKLSGDSTKKRKYDGNYLAFGFTWTGNKDEPNGLCVECEKVVSNSSLNPAKLKRHLELNHPYLRNKTIEYFQRKHEDLISKKNAFSKYMFSDNEASLEASFRISYRIAREGEAYTIAEKLIKPCLIDVISCKLGDNFIKDINSIPLSDTTVARRIKEMAQYCEHELLCQLKSSSHRFTLQLDESTDVAGLAILIVLVRYVFNSSIQEDMLFCKPLVGRTTGEEIFKLINSYMQEHELSWDLCSHICTDGAKSLLGREKGAISRIIAIAPHIEHSHCCLHRHQLVAKRMSKTLKNILDEAVQIINFIKKELNSRLFSLLCEELSSTHKTLLLHAEVRWLSCGKILNRFFELKDEIRIFLNDRKHKYAQNLNDEIWLQLLAYLADIFTTLNEFNKSLQGLKVNIIKLNDKINALILKLDLWESYVKNNNTQCFKKLSDFLIENGINLNKDVKDIIQEHILQLKTTIRDYFPQQEESHDWIKNPFQNFNKNQNLLLTEQEQLIELSKDSMLKCRYEREDLLDFWLKIYTEYPQISAKAIKALMPFVTTYLCEKSFSTYVGTKTKYRNKLDAEHEIRLQITTIEPDFKVLCKTKQAHPSH